MNGEEVFEYGLTFGWYRVVVDARGVAMTPYRKEGGEAFPVRHASFSELDRVILRQRSSRRRKMNVILLKDRDGKKLGLYAPVRPDGSSTEKSQRPLAAVSAVLRHLATARPDLRIETEGADPAYLAGSVLGAVLAIVAGGLLDRPWTPGSWIFLTAILGVLAFGIIRGGLFRRPRKITAREAIERIEASAAEFVNAAPAR